MLGVYLEIGDEPLQIKKRFTSLGRRIKEICRIGHDHIQYVLDEGQETHLETISYDDLNGVRLGYRRSAGKGDRIFYHIRIDFDLKDHQNVSMVCQKALPYLGEMEKIMENHRIRIDDSLGILDFCKGNTSYRRFRHWLESKEAQDT